MSESLIDGAPTPGIELLSASQIADKIPFTFPRQHRRLVAAILEQLCARWQPKGSVDFPTLTCKDIRDRMIWLPGGKLAVNDLARTDFCVRWVGGRFAPSSAGFKLEWFSVDADVERRGVSRTLLQ